MSFSLRFPFRCALFALFSTIAVARAQDSELRGVWFAWAGTNVPSKTRIAQVMEDLAAHHVNTVFVDAWRFSYPYFRSSVFQRLTGKFTDPALPEGRDVLQEMIAEGHRVGLHVKAWFEYGFVAGVGANDDLYDARPAWFARRSNGSVLFNGSLQFKWLSHHHPQAQQFLIDLGQEVIANYDLDGIELDRIRYPDLDCGYDSATVALYKNEHNGNAPPQNFNDGLWHRWRADKINAFAQAAYDSFKIINPHITVSNAPGLMPSAYDNLCQDWPAWMRSRSLDFITPQVYRDNSAGYAYDLGVQLSYLNDVSKVYPGLAAIIGTSELPSSEIIAMIKTTRSRGLKGHVIWYYDPLSNDLPALRNEVYQQPVAVPGRPANWRRPALIVNEDDAAFVQRSNGWATTTQAGFKGNALFANSGEQWIEYRCDIPQAGWYEIYSFMIPQSTAMRRAPYEIRHARGVDTIYVDQTKDGLARWHKLGDFYLTQGNGQKILRLSNAANQLVVADAIMLLNTNRIIQTPVRINEPARPHGPREFRLEQNFPNPFGNAAASRFAGTAIKYSLPVRSRVQLAIYDLAGRRVAQVEDAFKEAGEHVAPWNGVNDTGNFVTSGIYFYRLHIISSTGTTTLTQKLTLLK